MTLKKVAETARSLRHRAALLLSLLIAFTHIPVAAADRAYWLCLSTEGTRALFDEPCPKGYQTLQMPSAESVPRLAQRARPPANTAIAGPQGVAKQAEKVRTASQLADKVFAPIIDVATKGLALMFGALILVVLIKALFPRKTRGRRSRRSPKSAERKRQIPPPASDRSVPALTPDLDRDKVTAAWEASKATQAQAPERWSLELLNALEWKRFEELCQQFWIHKGHPASLTGPGADGGVDVVIGTPSNADKTFAIVQCKSWERPVGVEPVRALWGAKDHFGASLAIFYGLSGFSEDAKAFAHGKHLQLLSGAQLLERISSLSALAQLELLKHVTRGDYTTPSCAKCKDKMLLRSGKGGKPDFWGCRNYPKCRSRTMTARESIGS